MPNNKHTNVLITRKLLNYLSTSRQDDLFSFTKEQLSILKANNDVTGWVDDLVQEKRYLTIAEFKRIKLLSNEKIQKRELKEKRRISRAKAHKSLI